MPPNLGGWKMNEKKLWDMEEDQLRLYLDPWQARALQGIIAAGKQMYRRDSVGFASENEKRLIRELEEEGIDATKTPYEIANELEEVLEEFTGSADIYYFMKDNAEERKQDYVKELKSRLKYWRGCFMRLASDLLHYELHTKQDILDSSPHLKDETLSDGQIQIRVQFDDKEVVPVTDIHLLTQRLSEALNIQFTSISIQGQYLIINFTQEGYREIDE